LNSAIVAFSRQRFRSGTADTVLGLSHQTLYAVLIRAYDLAAARERAQRADVQRSIQ
jgi:hypothetical protein